jgi:hypothetical protein
MSCTARGDPETPADILMSDLTEQDEILTRYSSHDLQEAYKLTHIDVLGLRLVWKIHQ